MYVPKKFVLNSFYLVRVNFIHSGPNRKIILKRTFKFFFQINLLLDETSCRITVGVRKEDGMPGLNFGSVLCMLYRLIYYLLSVIALFSICN